ncbi:hypothetical protein M513_05770 [Trichuris suis]|uniref:Integrase zinc-binding domain-containing protein n=1 Tax=Trichuris suis TaxID=68888 RepID=A0A085M7U3_9BILA|nr:hypothetical protein M513_05770 [Trichuris suis]
MAPPGVVRMKATARSYVWWSRLDEEIERRVGGCSDCQQYRNNPHQKHHRRCGTGHRDPGLDCTYRQGRFKGKRISSSQIRILNGLVWSKWLPRNPKK